MIAVSLPLPPPLSLYVHLPWCESKCPYCDFNSYAVKSSIDEAAYLNALRKDLDGDAALVRGREIQSIFIGGGTPSLFGGSSIDALLSAVRMRLPVANDAEITLESNPSSAEQTKFQAFKASGVNRLSIGAQSFDDRALQSLGRAHSAEEAMSAVQSALKAGFAHINIDLMFGLPQQTLALAKSDLEYAIALAPDHISYYQLTLEPNTLFYAKPPQLPDEALIEAMESAGIALLSAHHYQRYEVSAYAKPGGRSRHNLNYWNYGDYLGIGAGAHSKLTLEDGSVTRLIKHRQPASYLAAAKSSDFCSSRRTVSGRMLEFEFMLNATRLTEGFSPSLFAERTGSACEDLKKEFAELESRGLLVYTDERIYLTENGMRFLNEVQQVFLPEPGVRTS